MAWRVFAELVIASYGLVFGSFFGLVGMRVPAGESILSPPSRCSGCGRRLSAPDLVPVLSWLWARGRCRTCGVELSWLYPVSEASTAALFVLAWTRLGFSAEWGIALFAIGVFVALSVSDFLYHRLPDRVLLPSLAVLAVLRVWVHPLGLWSYAAGAGAGFVLLYLIMSLNPDGMGFGDVKLFAFVGLFVGLSGTFLTLILASAVGSVSGLVLRAGGKLKPGQPIPFGPAIGGAAAVVALYGEPWIRAYLSLIRP